MNNHELKIHLVFCGDRSHGKSTLIGRLMYETGRISEELLEQYKRDAEQSGQINSHFAWLLDRSSQERAQGVTSDIRFRDLHTQKHTIWAIDTPGHEDLIDRAVAGLSEADAGVLVVAVDEGVTKRTEEYAVLAKILAIEQLIVVISKIDKVNYSEQVINHVEQNLRSMLLVIGFKEKNLSFVPVSALYGENIKNKQSKSFDWFLGPTFIEALDQLVAPQALTSLPFRLPIDTVFYRQNIGIIVCGRIATGTVRKGDKIILEPGGNTGQVVSIEEVHKERPEFTAGDNVGVLIRGIDSSQVDIGYVMGHLQNPPVSHSWFTALVNVLHYPTRLFKGQTLTLLVHADQVQITIENIISRLDQVTERLLEDAPPFLQNLEKGVIQFRSHRSVVIERSSVIPKLSRFVLRESHRTIATGVRIDE